jgi:DNA polymerase I-like protein with 3'-5' exonuclease and polymerase domains
LAEHYQSGDIYWRFAEVTGLASRGDRKIVRALVKILFLAIGYGMGAPALAAKAGISLAEAHELLVLHATTYPDFTRWREQIVDAAYLHGWLRTCLGWQRLGCADVRPRRKNKTGIIDPKEELRQWGRGVPHTELMNWPVQSAGAEIMRIVCIAAVENQIDLLAPVHDGFLYMAPLDRLDHTIALMEDLMRRSSQVVTGGLPIKVETASMRYPDRYMDEKGATMWTRIISLYEARIRKMRAA